jgi:hypothetical protein
MVKKSILSASFVYIFLLNGAENNPFFAEFNVGGNKICLTKGSMYDADGKVDVMVIGLREQKRLDRTINIKDSAVVGDTFGMLWNEVCIMKKECESSSTEDHDNPCDIMKHRDHNFKDKKMKSYVLAVLEPRMHNAQFGKIRENYCCESLPGAWLQGEEAIQYTREGLSLCYSNVLNKAWDLFKGKLETRIALPLLGSPTGVNVPKKDACDVAVESIMFFLKRY